MSKTSRPSKIVARFPGDTGGTGQRECVTVFRSEAWLKAVRELEFCVICEAHGVQAAHRNQGRGKSQKSSDCLTAALCFEHHHEIDNGKNLTKEQRQALMDRAIVLTLEKLVLTGKVGLLKGGL